MSILMLMFVLGAARVAAAVGPENRDDAVKAELLKLEGIWQLVSLEVGGKAVNPETWGRNVRRTFSGTQSTFISGLRVVEGQISVDPSKTPAWIDETLGSDKRLQGIYELKGNTLRLYFEPQGGQRPTELKIKEGSQQAIQTYEQVLWTRRYLASGEVPMPDRIVRSDIVALGRVVAVEPKDVEATLSSESSYKIDYRIAVVKIHEVIHGQRDAKELRLGFVSPDQDRTVDKTGNNMPPLSPLNFRLVKVGDEGLFFLKKHHQSDFYVKSMLIGSFLPRNDAPEFAKNLENARRLNKVLESPLEALKAESATNRFLAATMLINRYRLNGAKATKLPQKAIDANESKLLLKILAEADWQDVNEAISSGMYPPHPYRVFLQLGVTNTEGYDPPRNAPDFRETLGYTQSWLRDNQEKYRIQRFSAESKLRVME